MAFPILGGGTAALADSVDVTDRAARETGHVALRDPTTAANVAAVLAPADALSPGYSVAAQSLALVFNPATAAWDRVRTPTIWKSGSATAAGSTTLWTPAAGKSFRILGAFIQISASATLAVAGMLTVSLFDALVSLIAVAGSFPASAITGIGSEILLPPSSFGPNGIKSAAANNVLSINLSAALTAGQVNVLAWGTEE